MGLRRIGRARALPIVAGVLLGPAVGLRAQETASPPLRHWIVDDSTKVLPGTELGASGGEAALAGAGGETVAFQLVLEASASRERVRIQVGDLASGEAIIARHRWELFLETYIDCPPVAARMVSLGPGRYPDPLVPLWMEGPGSRDVAHPLELPAGQRRVLWVDVRIPRGQPPGRYEGKIEVELSPEETIPIGVALERYAFDLPARPSLPAWVPLSSALYAERENVSSLAPKDAFDLGWRYFRMAHEHRLTTQSHDLQPRLLWDESTGALLSADWTGYDLVHAPVLDGSLFDDKEPPPLWKVGGTSWWGARWGEHPYFGGTRRDSSLTPAHRRALIEYSREVRRHFDERGWTRPELFMHLVHEPDLEALPQLPKIIAGYGEAIDESKANIRHLVTMTPSASPEVLGTVDIWAASGAGYRPSEMRARQALGESAWFYQAHEPFLGGHALNHEGLGLRSWAWIAWRYGTNGLFLWSGNHWNRDPYRNAVNWDADQPGHGVLFYPGAMLPTIGFPAIRGPVGSVRMKALRRGLLDHDYFALLRSLGGDPDPAVARIVAEALNEEHDSPTDHPLWAKHGAWSHDPEEWDAVRREIAREIEKRMRK